MDKRKSSTMIFTWHDTMYGVHTPDDHDEKWEPFFDHVHTSKDSRGDVKKERVANKKKQEMSVVHGKYINIIIG